MSVFAVDLALLRDVLLPDIRLTPGRGLMARVVAADGGGRGTLSIAGYLIDAELPRNVRPGQDLRLQVRDVDAQRVLLGIAEHPEAPQSAPVPPPVVPGEVPLPGGGSVRVNEDDDAPDAGPGGRRPGTRRLSLTYAAPALGRVDLRFELDDGALRVGVVLAPGEALTRAGNDADALREAVASAVDRAVSVTVTPRREPLDIYA